MTRVGIVYLTPEQLELLSAMAERPDLEVVGAVHADADSTPFKIAQVFAIPTDTQPEALRGRSPDLVVVPDQLEDVRREIEALRLAPEVLTTREAAARYGLEIEFGSESGVRFEVTRSPSASPAGAPTRSAESRGPEAAAAPPRRATPNLEVMLRDGLDELLGRGEETIAAGLRRLMDDWAGLIGAEACAVFIPDFERAGSPSWIVGGPRAKFAPEPDAVARSVVDGIGAPQIYLRYEPRESQESGANPGGRMKRALAAFPLEGAPGVLWFLDLRLPNDEVDERLMVLRRTARRLGRLLSLEGRIAGIDRKRSAMMRVADWSVRLAAASQRDDVQKGLRDAVLEVLHPELMVLRLLGSESPEVVNQLPPSLAGDQSVCVEFEEDLARSARGERKTKRSPATEVGDLLIEVVTVPLLHSERALGSVSIFRSRPHDMGREPASELWSDEETGLLERLAVHAAASLALASAGAAEPTPAEGVLDRPRLVALLRPEVMRAERYSVPFLLTVFELEPPPRGDRESGAVPPVAELRPEFLSAFARRVLGRMRGVDALARLGPRRFAVLNPHTEKSGGRVGQRVRDVLAELEGQFPGAKQIQVRANQIQFPTDVATLDDLLHRLGD